MFGELISGIGNIAGTIAKNKAGKKAAEIQQAGTDRSLGIEQGLFDKTAADWSPYQDAGKNALSGMGDADFQRDFTANDFTKDPGYDFRMAEGQKALERSAAAKGGIQSGGFAKALSQYGQNFASNEYGNAYKRFNDDRDRRFGRLGTVAGYGQNANQAMQGARDAHSGRMSDLIMGNAGNQGLAKTSAAGNWAGTFAHIGGMAKAKMDQVGKMGGSMAGVPSGGGASLATMNTPEYGWGGSR